jgi:hypothetical protein
MLWTVLSLASSLALFVSAVLAATRTGAGVGWYTLVTTTGLLLGASNAWAFERVARIVENRSKRYSERAQEWHLGVVYFAALLWVPFAALVGEWAALAMLWLAA